VRRTQRVIGSGLWGFARETLVNPRCLELRMPRGQVQVALADSDAVAFYSISLTLATIFAAALASIHKTL
jgi:hypothetical protein